MNLPGEDDYIDIHTHGSISSEGFFSVDTLMAHEDRIPAENPGIVYTCGIHPWYLNEINYKQLIDVVIKTVPNPSVVAVGEAGFDKLKGPSPELQHKAFEEQVSIAEDNRKPVIIHSVRAWDELFSEHKNLKPKMPWLVHGFRGNRELAFQIISKGIYLSLWFDFVIRPESTGLLKSLPAERMFLETDGADIDIRDIYKKVSSDLNITVDNLKKIILTNYLNFFKISP